MRRLPNRNDAKKKQQFITVRDGRMSYCVNEVYGKGDNTSECNVIIVFTNEQAGKVAEAIGFYPREGDTHYIADEDASILRKISDLISSIK